MDEVTKKWFDVSTVRVQRALELDGWYSDEELIRLSGAPKGSRLEVTPISDGRIELRTINADLFCEPLVRAVSQDNMEFSLEKNSSNWEHFLRYTKERNIEVMS